MDWQKILNITAICVVFWLLIIEWGQFQDKKVAQNPVEVEQLIVPDTPAYSSQPSSASNEELPTVESWAKPVVEAVAEQNPRLVTVTTDVFEVTIDTLGGDIVQVNLLQHLTAMAEDNGQPFTLLTRTADNQYVAQSGLIGPNATDTAAGRPLFTTASDNYELLAGDDELNVDFTLNDNGVKIVKRFQFIPADYSISVQYLINNLSVEPWEAVFYGQIKRDAHQPLVKSSGGIAPYLGAALRQQEKNYSKYDFSDMADETVTETIKGGWVAFVQHYFVSAWIPPREENSRFNLRYLPNFSCCWRVWRIQREILCRP
jgi:YidC/Oxa1 family membrane protein insertase